MNKIKLNVKYQWYSRSEPVLKVLNSFKRNNRKIKKCLKIALKDISNTLDIHDWNIIVVIRQRLIENDFIKYYIRIEVESKINNVSGYLEFCNIKELLSKNEGFRAGLLKKFHYIHKNNSFHNDLVSKKHTVFLMLNNFQENSENVIDFLPIENKDITDFKNKHENFLMDIHKNNFYTFDVEESTCTLQLFYVCDKIYWGCSYTLYDKNGKEKIEFGQNTEFTNIRNIKEKDRNTFLRSLIEAGIININQDIEEVLAWDIKDIFAMSKLIDY